MATGMTSCTLKSKSRKENIVFMTINLLALRHIASAGIRKRQGTFSKMFFRMYCNVPNGTRIKKEDQIFCCRQCITD
jgi:hypothetical protein